ncbi:hypothetical protein [Comamonas sp. lk]|uniref:hypothetical protein n=1 Tax=Comamonas sp. lk TaxID=2201272 RepID=UPI000EB4117C|nr:hypothetical protein [Comamonas sp. lk]
MKSLWAELAMVLTTVLMFLLALLLNEWLFSSLKFVTGINYIYLPAGMRLVCTLLFAEAGAVGLLLASWLVCYFYFFPDDGVRAFAGGVLASLAPYATYKLAQRWYGLGASLQQLTPRRLLVLSLAYAITSPLLHHLWFALSAAEVSLEGLVFMVLGDLSGTLIVLYTVKALLSLLPRPGSAYKLH